MTHRFFKAEPQVYEFIRTQIDAAWGYPTPLTKTSILPADVQYKDADGNCIIGVQLEWLEWEPVATLVPQMLEDGQVVEITEAQYWASMPQSMP